MDRKFKKLIRTPALYFKDLYCKKTHELQRSYSIVTANYNNSEYIDDFFNNVKEEITKYENKIEVIVVDDCSTDDSLEKLYAWKKRFPNQVRIIENDENHGPSYSRNIGLRYARNSWISFIDIDDKFSDCFFRKLDFSLSRIKSDVAIIFLKVMEWYPKNRNRLREHPLNNRFNGSKVQKIRSFDNITQSSTTSLFRRDLLLKTHQKFDERIKTTFEDGKFELEYMLSNLDKYIYLHKDGVYFYRKKQTSSSVSHSAWTKTEKYTTDLLYGYEILKKYPITKFTQRKCLYELFWYIKYLINKPVTTYVEPAEIERIFTEIFSNIPVDFIRKYNKCGCWAFHKVGMLGRFKGTSLNWSCSYIEEIDHTNGLLKVSEIGYYDEDFGSYEINGQSVEPVFQKEQINNLFGKMFNRKRIQWIPFKEGDELEFLDSTGKIANVSLAGKTTKAKIEFNEIATAFQVKKNNIKLFQKVVGSFYYLCGCILGYKDSWLFMDRDIWADDSAEVLFKWVKNNAPEQSRKSFFAVNKDAVDFSRLVAEEKGIIPFNSFRYKCCLNTCKWFISSQADKYQLRYLYVRRFKYAFLQHGIIKDDISAWLNPKILDLFVTSTYDEYNYVSGNGPFKYSKKEVVLTGLPRHDLLRNLDQDRNMVVIMPTWRKSLSKDLNYSNKKGINSEFYNSEFANKWKNFLHSHFLQEQSSKGIKFIFCPHINLIEYLDWFDIPEFVQVFEPSKDGQIRMLFNKCKLMITDSSSAAFEIGYLKKPVIYYQFDMDKMWSGSHTAFEGYFNYERDGFGPVCYNEEELIFETKKLIESGFVLPSTYDKRFEIFPAKSKSNCQLIFEEIVKR